MPEPGIVTVQLSYLAWLEQQDTDQYSKYLTFRNYYEGEQTSMLTARMRAFLELDASQHFNLNFCPIVVDSLAERLKVAGFECEDKPDTLREWWRKNRMDAVQGVVHTAAVRDGDTYLLVEWDNERQRPRFTQENAFDGTQGMHVVYSDERRDIPVVAIKRWTITSGKDIITRRCNLYYPDRIEKYTDLGTGKDWVQYQEEGQPWPIPWTNANGPLGVPVMHFRNKDQGYSYGESELEDVVPVQNGLQKVYIDLLAAADTTGFRIYTGTGYDGSSVKVAPGSFLWSTDPNARLGAIDPADLTGLIALKDSTASDIAKITRTPLSYFQLTGQVKSGEAQKEERSGLISKALDRQVTFGNAWEDLMYFARKLNNVFGPGGMDEEEEISTLWVDDERPEHGELADEALSLFQSQSGSIQTRVKLLHPDWDESAIAAEVALIKAEQGMDVPDLGPLASDEPPKKPVKTRSTTFVKDATGAIVGKTETETEE